MPVGQSAFVILRPEMRLDVSLSDVEGGHVRQHAFQAIADLDVHLPILDEDEEDRAVTLVFLTDAPGLGDALGIILDRGIRLHLAEDGDHDLVRSLALELRELLVETERGLIRDDVRVIIEISGRFGRNHFLPASAGCAKVKEYCAK